MVIKLLEVIEQEEYIAENMHFSEPRRKIRKNPNGQRQRCSRGFAFLHSLSRQNNCGIARFRCDGTAFLFAFSHRHHSSHAS